MAVEGLVAVRRNDPILPVQVAETHSQDTLLATPEPLAPTVVVPKDVAIVIETEIVSKGISSISFPVIKKNAKANNAHRFKSQLSIKSLHLTFCQRHITPVEF